MASGFQLDKNFLSNLAHTRGTLNPIGNVVRRRTDDIARKARGIAIRESAEARRESESSGGYSDSARKRSGELRALWWAMKVYADSIRPTMHGIEDGEDSTTGRVTAYYGGATAIEFGGSDPEVVVRDGPDHPTHRAHGILRRAVNGE